MSIRSMTDEQMLAKYGYDKEPCLHDDGHRSDGSGLLSLASGESGPFGKVETVRYAPRPECIPSRSEWHEFAPTPGRPTTNLVKRVVARPPVNPILSAFRNEGEFAESWIEALDDPDNCIPEIADSIREALSAPRSYGDFEHWERVTQQHCAVARKILERLARVAAVLS